jgi:hypothetical protein
MIDRTTGAGDISMTSTCLLSNTPEAEADTEDPSTPLLPGITTDPGITMTGPDTRKITGSTIKLTIMETTTKDLNRTTEEAEEELPTTTKVHQGMLGTEEAEDVPQ